MENTSKQVYIINLSNAIVMLQSNNKEKDTILTLNPYECSLTTFDLDYLKKERFVMGMLSKGIITLSETPKKVIPNKNNKDYGQKYKIGQAVYIVGEHNLTGVVDEYFPNRLDSKNKPGVYKVKLDKTGGCPEFGEHELSLSPFSDKQTEKDLQVSSENPLPSAQQNLGLVSAAKIVSSDNNIGNMGQDAEATLNNQDFIARNIQQMQSNTLIRTVETEKYVNNQNNSTFIDDSGNFAVEKTIGPSVQLQDIEPEEINVIDATVNKKLEASAKAAKPNKEDALKAMYDKLSKEDKEFFEEFKKLDYRGKKLKINELEDENKLEIIALFATDETSRKGASAKLTAMQSN